MTTSTAAQAPVRTSPLTDTEIRSFLRRGYVLPGRVFDDDVVTTLRSRLNELIDASRVDERIDRFDLGEAGWTPGDEQAAPGTIPFMTGLWKTEPVFEVVTFDGRITSWVGQLLGVERLAFLLDNVIIKPPRSGGELRWHQDWQAWPVAPCEVVTCWIALEDVTVHNGAMQMAAGSHALGRFLPQDGVTGKPKVVPGMDELIATGMKPLPDPDQLGAEIVTIELRAGECSMHHGLMWHRSGINTTTQTRHSLIQRYASGACRYSGKFYSGVDFARNDDYVDKRLEELDVFPVIETPASRSRL